MSLAIIGAGYTAKLIAQRARMLNIETYCFAWESGAVAKESVDHFFPISVLDKEGILEICKENMIDGVIAGADIGIATAAYIAEQMQLLGNSPELAHNIGDKFWVRERTRNIEGLNQIRYQRFDSYEEILASDIKFPAVIKPTDSQGKDGVILARNENELEEAFAFSKNGHEHVIVEEYIQGQEYSVESLSYKGRHYIIQITEKDNSGPPHFVELAHHQPADISDETREAIIRVMDRILTAINVENGPCCSEIKINENGIFLIEVNGRLGGDHIAYPLTELSSGYPYISGVIQAALGTLQAVEFSEKNQSYASVFFVVKQTEYLSDIFKTCESEDWCYEKHKATDELIMLERNDGFRINYFIYNSKTEKPDFLRKKNQSYI